MKTIETERYTLVNGDCIEYMRTLEDGEVDCIITDPPFGIDFKYNSHNDTPSTYDNLIVSFVEHANRLCCNGFIFAWQAMKHASDWHKWFPSDYRIFAALKNFTQYRPTPIQYSFDPVIFWKNGETNIQPVAGKRDYHMGNTAAYVAQKSNGHPCPRPLNTVIYIIEIASNIGDTIIDPFMGSGTTGVACMQLGRRFIGCEIDEHYFDIAAKRIADAAVQPPLFTLDSSAEKAEQLGMFE